MSSITYPADQYEAMRPFLIFLHQLGITKHNTSLLSIDTHYPKNLPDLSYHSVTFNWDTNMVTVVSK